jgi:hypothetical protein
MPRYYAGRGAFVPSRGINLRFVWTEETTLRAGSGHGVDFFVGLPSDETVAAHVIGFDWLRDEPDSVEVRYRISDDASDHASDDRMRAVVESYLRTKGPISPEIEEISPDIYVVVNG